MPRPRASTPIARAHAKRCSASRVKRSRMSESTTTCSAAPGRCTLITTAVPSFRVARCTWAIDAAAKGVSSKLPSTSSGSRPHWLRSMVRMFFSGAGAAVSHNEVRAVITAPGSTSGRVDSTWPSLMKVTPERLSIFTRASPKPGESGPLRSAFHSPELMAIQPSCR